MKTFLRTQLMGGLCLALWLCLCPQLTQAQCVPDSNLATITDLQPDELVVEGCSFVDTFFNFYFPPDTNFAPFGLIPFESYTIDSIKGLPPGFSWECSNPDCFYDVTPAVGDTFGCVRIFGNTNNIPASFNFSMCVTVTIPTFGSFEGASVGTVVVKPCVISGDCYELNLSSNCEPADLAVSNVYALQDSGISYHWDYGDGFTSINPIPPTHTYTDAGIYDFTSTIVIDTSGFFLTGAVVDAFNCDDGILSGGDLYWKLFAPDGTELLNTQGSPINDATAPVTVTGISLMPLELGTYEFQLWDDDSDDPFTGDDGCATAANDAGASVFFTILPGTPSGPMTVTQDGLTVTFSISHPVDTLTCSNELIIDPLPDVPIIVTLGDTAFCIGDSVTLITTSDDSIQWWFDGAPIFDETGEILQAYEAGEYWALAINRNTNCIRQSASIFLTQEEIPEPTFTISNDLICANISGPYVYQWYVDGTLIPGSNNPCHDTGGDPGVYTIVVENPFTGCTESSEIAFPFVSIEDELDILEALNIYPNPAHNQLFVDVSLVRSNALKIRIQDMYGRTTYLHDLGQKVGQVNHEISVEEWNAGIYILTLETEEGSVSQKIILY